MRLLIASSLVIFFATAGFAETSVSVYVVSGKTLNNAKDIKWTKADAGWEVATMPASQIKINGSHNLGAANLTLGKTAEIKIREKVSIPNWYHAYALEKKLIPTTVVFERVDTALSLTPTRRVGQPKATAIKILPIVRYHTGSYEGKFEVRDASFEVLSETGACVVARPLGELTRRLLRPFALEDPLLVIRVSE